MSLLIKALEQAAKDREANNTAQGTGDGLSAGNVASLSDAGAQRRTASSLSGLAHIESQQRARAASIVQAGDSGSSKLISYLRGNPVAMAGAVAAVAGVAFGIYVYMQIAMPGAFSAKTPPPAPASLAKAPAPPPAPSADANMAAAPPPAPVASPPPEPAMQAPFTVPAPTPSTSPSSLAAAPAPAGAIPPPRDDAAAARSAGRPLIPTNAVVAGAGNVPAMKLPPEREPVADVPREPKATGGAPPAPAAARVAVTAAPRERIVVSSVNTKPSVNPMVSNAYTALQSGDLDQARAGYARVIETEPLNVDAMMGLAYIAAQQNRSDDATKQYLRILQIDPRNTVAQAGMIALVGRADALAAESRLKELISREPSPFLHFVLGNLYADQSAWSQAQQSFFQAHHLEPDNAEYAYNLAVSLDHLRQSKLALNFYRRADQIASTRGRANFNVSQARERIRSLSAQIE